MTTCVSCLMAIPANPTCLPDNRTQCTRLTEPCSHQNPPTPRILGPQIVRRMLQGIHVKAPAWVNVAPPTCFSGSAILGVPAPGTPSGASPPSAPAGALWQAVLMVFVLCMHAHISPQPCRAGATHSTVEVLPRPL